MAYYLVALVIVLPSAAYGIYFFVSGILEENYLSEIRGYSHLVADRVEALGPINNDQQIVDILDSVLLSGYGVYAEYRFQDLSLTSELSIANSLAGLPTGGTENGPDVSVLSISVLRDQSEGTLVLGFDREPLNRDLANLAVEIVLFVLGFTALSVLLLRLFARRVSRPLRKLEKGAAAVRGDNSNYTLLLDSGIREIDALSDSLEQMRSELVQANERLRAEMRIREETEATRMRLEKSLLEAERLKTVGTLAGGVAHEFNNILQPMKLNLELFIEDFQQGLGQKEHLDRVLDSIERATDVVYAVSNVTAKERGRVLCLDLVVIIKDVLAWLSPGLPSYIELDTKIPENPVYISAREGSLHQIMANIIKNAIQAMPDKGKLEITLRQTDANASIRVTDTGSGISDEVKKHLFEPFYTTRAVGQGSGLGLSVVYSIVAELNGEIHIDSIVGQGTIVEVSIPIATNSE